MATSLLSASKCVTNPSLTLAHPYAQKPTDPFEKETLATLFAAAGIDQGDVLLLGEDMTLKGLCEMPDEVRFCMRLCSCASVITRGTGHTKVAYSARKGHVGHPAPRSAARVARCGEGARGEAAGEGGAAAGEGGAREARGGAQVGAQGARRRYAASHVYTIQASKNVPGKDACSRTN